MGRTLRGELRKLAHPAAAIIVIVCFAFILTDARTTYDYARLQAPIAILSSAHLSTTSGACQTGQDPVTAHCQALLDQAAEGDSFAANGIALARVTNSLSTWPGMLRFVSHELATGLGWVLIAVLIGVHVAGEWSSRTAGTTLLASVSRARFWLAKVVSLLIAMIGIAMLGTTVLYLTRHGFLGTVGIPAPLHQHGDPSTWQLAALPVDPAWSSWATSLGGLGVTAIIWLMLVLVGVACAGLIRKTLATVALLVAVLAIVFALARYAHRTEWSPLAVVGRSLSLAQTPFGVRDTRLWSVPGAPGSIQDGVHAISASAGQVLAWLLIAPLLALVMSVVSSRRRVRG